MGNVEARKDQIQNTYHSFAQNEAASEDDDRGVILASEDTPVPAHSPTYCAG